jgi:hypothetical protein
MQLKRFLNKVADYNKFTLVKYCEFLESISQYKIIPCREFQTYFNSSEIVITLKHDIDSRIDRSINMAILESEMNIRSSYFVLHTAGYYKNCIEKLKFIQSLGHEIGFHNDLMSVKNPVKLLNQELAILRTYGLRMTGTSAHGNKSLREGINNLHFWNSHNLKDFGFDYEAYSLDFNKYFSDCTFIDGHRWHPEQITGLRIGDRMQFLIHPEFWHK